MWRVQGDVVVLQFDMPTNRHLGVAGGSNATGDTTTAVDALFSFSHSLGPCLIWIGPHTSSALSFLFRVLTSPGTPDRTAGTDYSGEWVQADRFVVTIIDASGGNLT
jgi:hypothetical protein